MNVRRLAMAALVSVALVSACGSDDSSSSSNAGTPGKAAEATRTVDVKITAAGYEPATISAAKGETVTSSVTNSDSALHEFVLGNEKAQKDWEKTMADMSTTDTMLMPDTANIIEVPPGQSKTITWTFPNEATTVIYGSHQPNDYKKYKGTITVK